MKRMMILAVVCLAGSAHAERWNKGNTPSYFNAVAKNKMNFSFSDLPLEAKIQDQSVGWSDTYWPSNVGGIAYRWSSANPQPFTYKLKTKAELLNMSQSQLSELSPAELYDISQGDYKYTLTKKILKTYNPKNLWWEGICHGWSLAASHYSEPAPVTITNRDGINVPFGSSDVKGLLSMHDAYNSRGTYVRVGDRCKVKGKVKGEEDKRDGILPIPTEAQKNQAECSDVNAGTFHIVLTNMIGINSQGFVADVDRFNDVWNQPVTSYISEVVGMEELNRADLKNGVNSKIRMKTKMVYGEELKFRTPELEAKGHVGFVSKDPVTGTPAQTFEKKFYEYILELDINGNIIGGEWISETRPDMLWLKARDVKFYNGKFPLAGLNAIYVPVTK